MQKEKRIGRSLFIGILILHILGCYVMGAMILINPKLALETGFHIHYSQELEIISLVIGMELFFLGTMALLGVIWTRKHKLFGVYIGTAVGVYMFFFGIVAFLKLGTTDALVVDSIRGFITIVFGILAYRELKQKKLNE